MYVIGVSEYDFIDVKSKILTNYCKIWQEVEKVVYECDLNEATFSLIMNQLLKYSMKYRKEKVKFNFKTKALLEKSWIEEKNLMLQN